MSRITSKHFSDADIQKKTQRNARAPTRKTNKKPLKSNITSKMRTRRSEILAPSDVKSDDDEGDSSATEKNRHATDDPDVVALPGALRVRGDETAKRLAGLDMQGEDMFPSVDIADDVEAIAGAYEEEYEGSDEDGYEDVEDVSDENGSADGSGRSVLRSAEKELIHEFEQTEQLINATAMANDMDIMALEDEEALARRLNLHGSDSQVDDFGFAVDMNEDPYYGFRMRGNTYRTMWDEAETSLWRMPETARSRESSDPTSATQKRVRFQEVSADSSSGSDDEDPNAAFPDLLDAADVTNMKQEIALGLEFRVGMNQAGLNDAESFYDFEDEDEKLAFLVDEESDSDDDLSSSDSEDEGDTTDDETREEQIARMKARKQALAELSKEVQRKPRPAKPAMHNAARTLPSPSTSRPTTPKSSKALKFGTFALDPTRATMTMDSDSKKIKLLPPATPSQKDKAFWERAKTANHSRDGTPGNHCLTIPAPGADSMPDRPFTTESTLGLMFQGNLDIIRNNDVSGIVGTNTIVDDMIPATMLNPHTSFVSTTVADSDLDHEDINMEDFVEFSDDDSDTDEALRESMTSPAGQDGFSPFMPAGNASRRGSDFMDHFDQYRDVVGSFRRNQHQAKHMSSLASHPAQRAKAHEFNGFQKGRRGAANTPITPARKKRISQDLTPTAAGVRKSISSPFAARRPRSRGNSLVSAMAASDLYQTLAQNPFDQA